MSVNPSEQKQWFNTFMVLPQNRWVDSSIAWMECASWRAVNNSRALAHLPWAKCIATLSPGNAIHRVYVRGTHWQRTGFVDFYHVCKRNSYLHLPPPSISALLCQIIPCVYGQKSINAFDRNYYICAQIETSTHSVECVRDKSGAVRFHHDGEDTDFHL